MLQSTERILTTHVGSLPRPQDLLDMIEAKEKGEPYDEAALSARTTRAIDEIVRQQVASGIDVVCDGENSKVSYTFYVRHRLDGVGVAPASSEVPQSAQHADLMGHPDFVQMIQKNSIATTWFSRASTPCCVGPISYANRKPLEQDLQNLQTAVTSHGAVEAFMNAPSPGVLTKFVPDTWYQDEDAYVQALADALAVEYEAIANAGFILQIDAPDMGSARHNQYKHLSDAAFLRIADRNIAALNHATRNIPPERMRMHICWGNYEGPHTHDVPLKTIFDVAMKARPQGLLFEAANPAHAHEWEDLEGLAVPEDKVLIPGVIDSTTNFVENPRLVAQRIRQYANTVGRERVIAGTDCGFATFAGPNNPVAPSVVWAKLRTLSEGAALASTQLWKRGA